MDATVESVSLVPWSSVDIERLAAFLNTDTGMRLLPKAAERCPLLLEAGESNAILIRNGKVIGFREALQEIFSLAHAQPVAKTDSNPAYPPLDDDAAWNDGQKLTPAK